MRKAGLQLAAGLGLGLVVALLAPHFGAVGQYYATPTPRLPTTNGGPVSSSTGTIDDDRVTPGQLVTISGSGFAPAVTLTMTFFSHPRSLGTTQSDSAGAFRASVRIPTDAEAGRHVITVVGPRAQGGTHTVQISLSVSAGALPETGSSTLRDIAVAFAILTLGELFIGAELLARRRKRLIA